MFDVAALVTALAAHGRLARVVVAAVEGSSPREVGASMLVWESGQSGTIGGGSLEFAALSRAREALAKGEALFVQRMALGPVLGQCCGGAVQLWTEVYDAPPLADAGVVARGPGAMPLAVKRVLAMARGQGVVPASGLVQGWLVEPVAKARRDLWVWGAGHVGRAVVSVLVPLPDVAVTWVDITADRFPDQLPDGVVALPVAQPERAVALAPDLADHLVLTYSHALDLELCHRLLSHGFRSCGVIGSATKWARFRARLLALGHSPQAVARIDCPIGEPSFGKHPQAIAVGVASRFLRVSPDLRARERA